MAPVFCGDLFRFYPVPDPPAAKPGESAAGTLN